MRVLLLVALAVASPSLAESTDFCPPLPPLAEGQDDLRIAESGFTQERYEAAIQHLLEFPARIINAEDLRGTVASSETWIGYENSLRFVRGWVLKQAAVAEAKSGHRGAAVEAFCAFAANAAYAD